MRPRRAPKWRISPWRSKLLVMRARPAELDCAFESVCETCTFFAAGLEFRPTLQAQHDDAATKNQTGRAALFTRLLTQLDHGQASHDTPAGPSLTAPRSEARSVNVQRPQAKPRTNDVDHDEPRSILPQRGPATTNHDYLTWITRIMPMSGCMAYLPHSLRRGQAAGACCWPAVAATPTCGRCPVSTPVRLPAHFRDTVGHSARLS
jgi:hypothetical protein